ncbi:MAG: DUF29 family protein [Roseofilum sp. SBFL]|uniref:DUF29 family protein n=1 Tax=Roseofilum sp. SBFL TaxID=2821496 RepID=UPI001B2B4500|nr:DUF29 family protein [Roseofilum sp. SBFL]MBP0040916.1 DUF29 family protein [Roseofilum sp. SBFL]
MRDSVESSKLCTKSLFPIPYSLAQSAIINAFSFTSQFLRDRQLERIDQSHLAEELKDLGKSEKRAIASLTSTRESARIQTSD